MKIENGSVKKQKINEQPKPSIKDIRYTTQLLGRKSQFPSKLHSIKPRTV